MRGWCWCWVEARRHKCCFAQHRPLCIEAKPSISCCSCCSCSCSCSCSSCSIAVLLLTLVQRERVRDGGEGCPYSGRCRGGCNVSLARVQVKSSSPFRIPPSHNRHRQPKKTAKEKQTQSSRKQNKPNQRPPPKKKRRQRKRKRKQTKTAVTWGAFFSSKSSGTNNRNGVLAQASKLPASNLSSGQNEVMTVRSANDLPPNACDAACASATVAYLRKT